MQVNVQELPISSGVSLGTIEVGLGSLLHAFHIPFSGHFLSLNQIFFLSRNIKLQRDPKSPIVISNMAALLKSLSPVGNRLGPMLSLSTQGLLFSLGNLLFGANFLGALAGGTLLGFWAFFQQLVTAYIFFGADLFHSIDKILGEFGKFFSITPKNWIFILVILLVLKTALAWIITTCAFFLSEQNVAIYEGKLKILGSNNPVFERNSPNRSMLRDLTHPFFLVSMGITLFFAVFSENRFSQLIWVALRPIGLTVLLFYFKRSRFFQNILTRIMRKTVTGGG